jgi:hypothetical protein
MKSFTFRVMLVISLVISLLLFASIPPAFAAGRIGLESGFGISSSEHRSGLVMVRRDVVSKLNVRNPESGGQVLESQP